MTWGRIKFRVGTVVCRKDDPRHTGRIEAVFDTVTYKIRWHGNRWISFEDEDDLERA